TYRTYLFSRQRPPTKFTQVEKNILNSFDNGPSLSTRSTVRMHNVLHSSIHKSLKESHFQKIQALRLEDYPQCYDILPMVKPTTRCFSRIYWESVVDTDENPHAIHQHSHQNYRNALIGPRRLSAANLVDFLEDNLLDLLDDIPYAVRRDMWFKQDNG
ncbi:hypothetical protein ILUMI_18083, partial [Ignelater luminosus]